MAFVYHSPNDPKVKVDILFVPAIGADPKVTWTRNAGKDGQEQPLYSDLARKLSSQAQIHLYDHLTLQERASEKLDGNRAKKTKSPADIAGAEAKVAPYGITEWADRLLGMVRSKREARTTGERPIVFICHSTGGTIVKEALARKPDENQNEIANACIGVTFFATPHHGSKVLSGAEYISTVQEHLDLKWQMSQHLRNQFVLKNVHMETLNHRFAVTVAGIKIHSYVESVDTFLDVVSTTESRFPVVVRLCVVDSTSGKLSTPEVPVEDEETVELETTHVNIPRFEDQDKQYELYLKEIEELVSTYSAEERAVHQKLNESIMMGITVDVHQFYGAQNEMKILSTHPTLEAFLDQGPAKLMSERIRGFDKDVTSKKSNINAVESTDFSEPAKGSDLLINNMDDVDSSSDREAGSPSSTSPPKNSNNNQSSPNVESIGTKPANRRAAKTKSGASNSSDKEQDGSLQKQATFELPGRTNRFKWIHVPFTHPGWVHHILPTISQEKEDLSLHLNLLRNKIWIAQHNKSRHTSTHARFVRPTVKSLHRHKDGMFASPTGNGDDIQFVAYLPYLHWDTFENMNKRAKIIQRRRTHVHARPVPPDIANSKSIEHKLIWQYLTMDRPLHCRRTLDQYGYPSLRNTKVRDADQILWKRTKQKESQDSSAGAPPPTKLKQSPTGRPLPQPSRPSPAKPVEESSAKVLMVDQLWLWIVDNDTVITFFPGREKNNHDGYSLDGDIRSLIYRDINGDYATECYDPFDFAALATSHAVKALLGNTRDRNLEIFRIFEEYISELTEQQTSSFKGFRDNHRFSQPKDIEAEKHVVHSEDLNALLELRDIEDELNTIDKLFKEQHACIEQMIVQFEIYKANNKGEKGLEILQEVKHFIEEHQEQLGAMLKSSQAAKKAYIELLDMKQKQANIIEAHLARDQTKVATDQSRTVLIFTLVTIIFLPLSFFASIYGMNAKEWSGVASNPSIREIFFEMVLISVSIIIIALLAAFSRTARRLAQSTWKWFAVRILRLVKGGDAKDHSSGSSDHAADLEKAVQADLKRHENRFSTISRRQTKTDKENRILDMLPNGSGG